MNIIIAQITPVSPGFAELKAESMAAGFNMLRRLEENWLNGHNRFDKPGEKLAGAYADDVLVGVCGLNQDPYDRSAHAGRWRHLYVAVKWRRMQVGNMLLRAMLEEANRCFDYINTNAPESAFAFYKRAGFITLSHVDNITHRLLLKEIPY